MQMRKAVPLIAFFIAMLLAMHQMLGERVAIFAACFSGLWFVIAFVLLTRPPGIPEFTSQDPTSLDAWGDDQTVVRRELMPQVPFSERLRLSLTVACGSCMLIWLSLTLLAK